MPIGPARMPLFDHLGELRMRLVRIVVSLFIAMCVFYMATPTIIQFMCLPVADYLPKGDDGLVVLNVLDVFGSFTIRFKVALWASVVACMPIILWQILAFFLPALKPNERKWFIPTFAVGVLLFMFGTVFCYLFILHPAVQWLTDQAGGFAQILPDAKSWVMSSSTSSCVSASHSNCRSSCSTWLFSTSFPIRSSAARGVRFTSCLWSFPLWQRPMLRLLPCCSCLAP